MRKFYCMTVLTLLAVVMFAIFAAVWVLTVPFDRNRTVCHRVSRFWSKMIYRICPWWRVRVSGLEHAVGGGPFVVVANHQAMLDIPLLYVLPFNFKWVSKREVYRIPLFGWVLWMHGDVAIERGGAASAKAMLRQCEAYLRRGVSIVMFPEGTRTKTGRVNGFKEGAMLLAKQSGAAILPVVIDGTFDAFADGSRAEPHTFRVEVLAPVKADEVARTPVRELRDRLNGWMRETHESLAPQRYREKQQENTILR